MRRSVVLWCAVAAFAVGAAHVASAGQQLQLGRTVTDVQVAISGVPTDDVNVVSLIETRIGDALSMQAVRNTIDHLVGLGRFEDVRVLTTPTSQGVSLRWQLTPVRRRFLEFLVAVAVVKVRRILER